MIIETKAEKGDLTVILLDLANAYHTSLLKKHFVTIVSQNMSEH